MNQLTALIAGIITFIGSLLGINQPKFVRSFSQTTIKESIKSDAIVEKNPSLVEPINEGVSLTVTSPVNNSQVTATPIIVKGKTIPNTDVFINEKDVRADSQGYFSTPLNIEEGQNYIMIMTNDEAGNYAEHEIVVNLTTQ